MPAWLKKKATGKLPTFSKKRLITVSAREKIFQIPVRRPREEIPTQVEIEAGYPVALGDTIENLRAAAAGEREEWDDMYPEFARIAKEEGFPEIAAAWLKIADVEKRHETRFLKLKENVEKGQVFQREEETAWICQKCGYVHIGKSAPKTCPTCLHPQAYFELFVENY